MILRFYTRALKVKRALCYMLGLVILGFSPFLMYDLYVRSVERQFYYLHMDDTNTADNSSAFQCIIPDYDPNDPNIRPFLEVAAPIKCGQPQLYLSYLDDEGFIHLNKTAFKISGKSESDYECTYAEIFRPNETDNEYTLGVPQVFRETEKIRRSPYVVVKCYLRATGKLEYETAHFYVPVPPDTAGSKRSADRDVDHPSVLIFGLDSMSRLNFVRQLPRTYHFLTTILDSVVFTGMTKCGDNTFPNMMALLSGKNVHKRDVETNLLSVQKPDYFDDISLVWDNFSTNGYTTMYNEDWPSITLFNFGASGFKYVPTDYYVRPLWLALDKIEISSDDWRCYGNVPKHLYLLDYVKQFTGRLKDHKYFAYAFLTLLSHDDLNMVQVADADLEIMFLKMWREGSLNNTILIVLGDHGNRFSELRKTDIGRVEERMPFLSVWLPPEVRRKYPHLDAGLRSNSDNLVSWYDFYEMLMDLANNNLGEESAVPRYGTIGSSPFRSISHKRTCEDAGIPEEYCICARETQLSVNDTHVKAIAGDLTEHINSALLKSSIQKGLCAPLSLTSILSAQLLTLGPQVAKPRGFRVLYRVMMQVSPSDALFEGTLELDAWSERGRVVGDVNRINRYGKQSHCVSDRILQLYCFCTDLLKS